MVTTSTMPIDHERVWRNNPSICFPIVTQGNNLKLIYGDSKATKKQSNSVTHHPSMNENHGSKINHKKDTIVCKSSYVQNTIPKCDNQSQIQILLFWEKRL